MTIPPEALQPRAYISFSNQTSMQTATSPLVSSSASPSFSPHKRGSIGVIGEHPEISLEPLPAMTSTPGEVSSGPSGTMAQIFNSIQDQSSVTSNPVVTAPQSSGNLVTDNTVTQSPSFINHQSSSSFNNDIPSTLLLHIPSNTVTHTTASMDYQTSSSSNGNPSQTLPLDSMLNDHPPAQTFPATTLAVVPIPTAAQTALPAVFASSVMGLGDAISAGTGIVQSGASATPGKPASGVIQSGGNGSWSAMGSGSATKSVSGQTSVPYVFTGGAEKVDWWESWFLGFGILLCGVGMVYWV